MTVCFLNRSGPHEQLHEVSESEHDRVNVETGA